jgi:exo-beta-1,3-glucanase (GH17 family)
MGQRPLPPDFVTRRAVNYSPFRTSANEAGLAAEVIPVANIRQDLDLMMAAGIRLIRLFDSSDKVARQTLTVIRDSNLDMKVQLGAYVMGGQEAANQAELARTVALANEFRGIVSTVSVGNETMVSWSRIRIEPATMAGYLRSVRSQIGQPVTTNDNYAFWAAAPAVITEQIDYVALHTYAVLDTVYDPHLWDWRQKSVPSATRASAMMDAAMAETRRQYQLARTYLDGQGLSALPIVIGETGWNAVDLGRLRFRASPVNQKMFLDRLDTWAAQSRSGAGPRQIFYFEAFDEPWKQGDDKWGLFNKDRQARFAIQSIRPDGATVGTATWVHEPVSATHDRNLDGMYTEADANAFEPPELRPPVAASRYILQADKALAADAARAAGLRWDAFDGNTAHYAELAGAHAPHDAANSLEIRPTPAPYGWGVLNHSPEARTENLSGFSTAGSLSFWVSTTYPGKIEIGISTDTQDREPQEAFLQVAPGSYGYCNTGAWCKVSIPLKDFLAANSRLDLSLVLARFMVADRYAYTGKSLGAGVTTRLLLDDIAWER